MDNSFFFPLKISSLTFENNIWLAPMAGITNLPFRKMCLSFGAGATFSEMVSVEGIIRDNKRTLQYLDKICDSDVIQLFGSNCLSFYKAGKLLVERFNLKILDINFGCPVKKVIKGEAGSFLLKYPDRMGDIVKALKDAGVEVVSAKIRAGFDKENLGETIPVIDKAGADIITLHARLATQFYRGRANHDYIIKARELTDKVLIANGDIKTPEEIKDIILKTKVNGVMLGRIAMEKPYIFKMTKDFVEKGSYEEFKGIDNVRIILSFVKSYCEYYKTDNIVSIRGILLGMIKGIPFARELRDNVAKIREFSEFKLLLERFCYD